MLMMSLIIEPVPDNAISDLIISMNNPDATVTEMTADKNTINRAIESGVKEWIVERPHLRPRRGVLSEFAFEKLNPMR